MPEFITKDSARMGLDAYVRAMDSLDADEVASFFSAGASANIAGIGPIRGREAIRRAFLQLSLELDELHHEPVMIWSTGELSILEADLRVRLADGSTLSFPVTHVLRWRGGLIDEARTLVYMESRVAMAMAAFERLRTSKQAWPLSSARGR